MAQNKELTELKNVLEVNESHLERIKSGKYLPSGSFYELTFNPYDKTSSMYLKPDHIRRALVEAIDDLKTLIRAEERKLAQLLNMPEEN